MRARFVARSLRAGLFTVALAVGGCVDQSTGAPMVSPEDGSRPLTWSPDPEIVPGDTYYLLDVVQEGSTTYQTAIPVIDPVTNVSSTTWTVEHETETQRVEAGYDASGRVIQVLDETTPAYDPMERAVNLSRRTRSVEDEITSYGPGGVVLPTDHEILPNARAEIAPSHSQITDGVVLDAEALDTLSVLSIEGTPLASAAGPRARARRVGSDQIEVVNELAPDLFGPLTDRGAAMPGSRGSYVRTWRRHGKTYLLERTELVSEWPEERGVRKTARQVDHIRVVRLRQHARRDAERSARRGGLDKSPELRLNTLDEPPGDYCTVGQDCPPEDPPPPDPPATECQPVPGGAHILFQHGINSDRHTFDQMALWLACGVSFGRFQSSTIDWRRRITEQRDELRATLPAGAQNLVLIGHSNGGLVTRSLAQWAQVNQPGLVRGVITLDSPNQGALIAQNVAVAAVLLSSTNVLGTVSFALLHTNPYILDDVPGSPFLQNLNGFNEQFVNVGIQTHTPKRWVAWRILKTGECLPVDPCELAVARRAQKRYDDMRHTSKFWYRPWHAIAAEIEAQALNAFDATWNRLTVPGDLKGDGFIHGTGQYYPGARRNQLIPQGSSHTGTAKSELVRAEVVGALANQSLFNIPTPQ